MADNRETYFRVSGWRPSIPDPGDILADTTGMPTLAHVDSCAPIYDQGHLGSCTPNAIAAAIDADRLVDGQGAMTPSRLAIYWLGLYLEHQSATADLGATGRDGFKVARNYSVLPQSSSTATISLS